MLSPILYSLYTSDLPITDRCFPATYADDTAFFTASSQLRFCYRYMTAQITAFHQWARRWRLKVNTAKSVAVIHTRRRQYTPQTLTYNNSDIPHKSEATYLGVRLDRGLTFFSHIRNIKCRALRKINALFVILRCAALSHATRVYVLKMIVLSTLTYASPAWQHAA